MRQINRVKMTGVGKTEVSLIDQFIVRIGLPPFKAGEELNDVAVSDKHGLSIVAADVMIPSLAEALFLAAQQRVGPETFFRFQFRSYRHQSGHCPIFEYCPVCRLLTRNPAAASSELNTLIAGASIHPESGALLNHHLLRNKTLLSEARS